MKLFFAPGACSRASHIALREAGMTFDLEAVNLGSKKTTAGADFWAVNTKGAVPALQTDSGDVLTEGTAIMQFIADKNPASKLAPAFGTMERYHLIEWLNYIAAELHKTVGALWNPAITADQKTATFAMMTNKFNWVEKNLAGKNYLMGDTFTIADGYLFTIVGWCAHFNFDLAAWPNLQAYMARVAARPAVAAAIAAEKTAN